jgi:hypothetical protein
MKKLLIALLAATAVAAAAPAAFAHDDDDWSAESYGQFTQHYQHIWEGIQHGVSDGSYTPSQARYFYRQLQNIRGRAEWQSRSGYYDPQDINDRLEDLHDRMHVAHERGHDRLDSYGYGAGAYSYAPYSYRYGR